MQKETLFSRRVPEEGFGRRNGHLSSRWGVGGSGGPGERSGPRGGSLAAVARVARPGLASREAAWRPAAAAPPLTPRVQIKMAQAPRPRAGGGIPVLGARSKATVPAGTPESENEPGPLPRQERPRAEAGALERGVGGAPGAGRERPAEK